MAIVSNIAKIKESLDKSKLSRKSAGVTLRCLDYVQIDLENIDVLLIGLTNEP